MKKVRQLEQRTRSLGVVVFLAGAITTALGARAGERPPSRGPVATPAPAPVLDPIEPTISKDEILGQSIDSARLDDTEIHRVQDSPERIEQPLMAVMGSGFSYQGLLELDGVAVADETCDFLFRLYPESAGGTAIGSTQTRNGVSVKDGLFIVTLDFTSSDKTAFNGEARWLELRVKCPPDTTFTTLTPRQELTPTPYALALPGLWTEQNATSPNLFGGFSGNSSLTGTVGVTISGGGASGSGSDHFVSDSYGAIGGGLNNLAGNGTGTTNDALYATVGGGRNNQARGPQSTVGGGFQNTASAFDTTVGGGSNNFASATEATVGGGAMNVANGARATIAGGRENEAGGNLSTVGGGLTNTAAGELSTIGGGWNNTDNGAVRATVAGGEDNESSGNWSTINGGRGNIANNEYSIASGRLNTTIGRRSVISGGDSNNANDLWCTIAGGLDNVAGNDDEDETNAWLASVGGGWQNVAIGPYSTIPGGRTNLATFPYTFAAGYRAWAIHQGAFVWADSNLGSSHRDFSNNFKSVQSNQFSVLASGGATFAVNNSGYVVIEDAGGRLIRTSTGGYLSTGGTWVNNSDAALKENFDSVNPREILDKLVTMPINTWSYKAEAPSIRHLGPTAQDFAKSFGLGDSYASISTVDADGVALAAVKGLYEIVREKDARITALEARVQALEARAGHSMFNASTILVCSVLAGFGLFGSVIRRRTRTGGAQ